MRELEPTVRALLAAAQEEEPKAKRDAGRVDTVFEVGGPAAAADQRACQGYRLLLLLRGAARRRGHGQGGAAAGRAVCDHGVPEPRRPLALPPRMRCSSTVHAGRRTPFHARVGAPPAPGPVWSGGQEGEREAERRLDRHTTQRGVARCLGAAPGAAGVRRALARRRAPGAAGDALPGQGAGGAVDAVGLAGAGLMGSRPGGPG